jgi:hypothetical protein
MDLNQANALATDMIEKYGMGTELNVFYKSNSPSLYSTYSEYTRKMIDQEVAILVKDAYKSALIRLQEKKEYIHHIADRLMYSIVMSHEELVNFRVEPKPKMISSWEHEWRIRNGLRVPSPEPPSPPNLRLTSLDGTSYLTSCNEVGSLSLNKAYDITGNISHLDDENESIPCDCELP